MTMSIVTVRTALALFLFVILGFAIYSNTLKAPFQLDDSLRIENNPHVRLSEMTLTGLAKAAVNDISSRNRPIANVTFALNYYFHQYRLAGYHVVNIVVHILTAFLVYLFIKIALFTIQHKASSLESGIIGAFFQPLNSSVIAFFSALVWLVHPVQIQSVTYIVQRMNNMAAMFYLLSLLLYATGRLGQVQRAASLQCNGRPRRADEQGTANLQSNSRRHYLWFVGSVLAWIFALGSKQTAITLPFFILLYEWYFFQDLSKDWVKHRLGYALAILAIFALISFLFLGSNPLEKLQSIGDYSMNEFTFWERVLTQPRVVIYYLSLLLYPLPSRLNLDYDFPLSYSLVHPLTTLLSVATIVAVIGLACYLARKERLISFAILWFFGNLVLESSVVPLAIIFEHRTYLPSVFVPFIMVTLTHRYVKPKWLGVAALCAAVAVFSLWTYQRNSVWATSVTLWKDCVSKSPNKARPHYNLGRALALEKHLDEAISQFRHTLRLKPGYVEAHNNLGVALMEKGDLNKAISHFYTALQLKNMHSPTHYNLGRALSRQGRLDDAISHFRTALKLEPHEVDTYNELGNALVRLGHFDEAADLYLEAIRIEPTDVKAYGNLGVIMMGQGRLGEAVGYFSKALQIKPDEAQIHSNFGVALVRQGRLEDAVGHFSEALRLNPNDENARYNLGFAMKLMGPSGAPLTRSKPGN
ncbi:MAG: tetratricopeptide repeat protein [Thermodesulfobacteriota bacterium]|nr:tetratricopeptide repeat protein [Thermodesulfobacteriota bacterium]